MKPGTKPTPVAERLWPKIQVRGPDECWPWTGYRASGYGRIHDRGKSERAHRIVYLLAVGPIPKGMQVCHRCDNPACCNPAHFFLGTSADNWKDMRAKGRGRGGSLPGEKHPQAKLTWRAIVEIRGSRETLTHIEMARRYGVTASTIKRIRDGKAWKEPRAAHEPPAGGEEKL